MERERKMRGVICNIQWTNLCHFKGKENPTGVSINTEIKETRRKYTKWYNLQTSINHHHKQQQQHQQTFDRFEIQPMIINS